MNQQHSQLIQIERLIASIEADGVTKRPWILESDVQQLRHLYAQRQEQLDQLARLRSTGALPYAIEHTEQQIVMLDKAIRYAEEEAILHAREAAGRPDQAEAARHL
jgi:hypothetical protein